MNKFKRNGFKRDKRECQILHAKKRFKERYGGSITDEQIKDLINDVQKGYCQPLSSITNRVTVFKSGEWVFLYDKTRKSIVTFITEDMVDFYVKRDGMCKSHHVGHNKKMRPEYQQELHAELLSKWG